MNVFIYYLSDSKGNIRYVGKTNQYLKQRLYAHILECKSERRSYKISWIKSLLNKGERPIIEVIDEVPEGEWQFWEQYWIEQFRQWGFNLTNLTIGGQGGNGYKHTSDSKKKMRKSKLGSKLPELQKKKISDSIKKLAKLNPNYNRSGNNIKREIDKELLYKLYITENLSTTKIANKLKFSKKKIWDSIQEHGIYKDKEIWKEQLSSKPKKVVLQYDLGGKLVKEWNCLVDISKELGFNKSNIANCCRGIGVSVSGYIWRYKDNFIEIDLNKLNYQKRKVKKYDLYGKFIKEYDSISETMLDGFNEGNVQSCCVGKQKSHGGYVWRYSEDKPPIKYENKTIRQVIQYDLNMNFIKEWDSIVSVSKELGIGGNSITTCCKGKYKSAGGFIWKYKNYN
jgi:hypothetical protein